MDMGVTIIMPPTTVVDEGFVEEDPTGKTVIVLPFEFIDVTGVVGTGPSVPGPLGG